MAIFPFQTKGGHYFFIIESSRSTCIRNIPLVTLNMCTKLKNCNRDARTPQPVEIFFSTMRYKSCETVQRLGYFQSSVSSIKVQIM